MFGTENHQIAVFLEAEAGEGAGDRLTQFIIISYY